MRVGIWLGWALMALTVSLTALPGAGWADDDNDNQATKPEKPGTTLPANPPGIVPAGMAPDLEIVYSGFQNPGVNDQLIQLTVTNRGKGPSVKTVARVITSKPEPTPWLRELDVKALAPGESTVIYYPLSASCNGHLIKALVNAPDDSNQSNNLLEWEVCPPPIVPESPPILVIVVPELLTPVEQRVGEHKDGGQYPAVEIYPTVSRRHGLRRTSEGPFGDPSNECDGGKLSYFPQVGFDFNEGAFCDENFVYQLILDFDLQWLRDLDKKFIVRAELLYGENPRNVSGSSPTCVGRVGLAPANWPEIVQRTSGTNSLTPALLTTEDIAGGRIPGGWDMTDDIGWASRRELAGQWHGLVLHGLDENLDAEEQKICTSHINDARLKLSYIVFK